MKTNSSMESESNCSIATYRIVQLPAHLLGSERPQVHSSFMVVPEISQNPSEILHKKASLVSASVSQICPFCHKFCRNPSQWRRHVNLHTGEVKYPCPLCGKVFLDKSTLSRHKKIHSGDKPWRCKMCNKCFHTLPSLRRHITVHNPAGRPFECDICQKRFPDRSSQKRHIFKHTGLRPYTCNICDKTFVYIADLNCHTKIHAETKDFICPHCKKEFIKLGNYQRHVKIHEGKMVYQCSVCHIGYNFQSSLTRHMLVHRQEKLKKLCIICNFCNARFSNRSALKRHLLLHFYESVKKSQTESQSITFISKNCDSKNDVNKRPLTYKEICFVRRNLKYCSVVQLDKLSKNGYKTKNKRKIPSSNSEEGQNRDDVETVAADSLLLRRPERAIQTIKNNCDTVSTLKKRSRGRPKKILPNLIFSRSLNTRNTTKTVVVPELKSEESAVGKRKRGRPRKIANIPANKNDSMFNKSLDVICNNSRELKRKRGRPRKNLGIFSEELSQLQETKDLECSSTKQKLEQGRPRRNVHIMLNTDKQRRAPTDLKLQSSLSILGHAEPKKKRGRPRKNIPNQESHQCQSQVGNTEVVVLNEITTNNLQQNQEELECLMKINKTISFDAAEKSLHDGIGKRTENFNTSHCKSTDIVGKNGHQCVSVREAESSGENSQASKSDEKMDEISCRKQALYTVGDNVILQQNDEHICKFAAVTEKTTFKKKIAVEMESTEHSFRKERGKHKEHIHDATGLQDWEVLPESKKCDKNCAIDCTESVDLMNSLLVGTHSLEKNCYSITLTPQDKLAIVPAGEEKMLKHRAKRKMPVFFICGDEVIEDCTRQLDVEIEKNEQTNKSTLSEVVTDVTKNIVSAQKLLELKHLDIGAERITDTISGLERPGVKEVILDDWQSDDSSSPGTL